MFRKPQNDPGLDEAIADLLSELKGFTGETDEFKKMMHHLETLYKIKAQEAPDHVSRDTMAIIAGNLAGIIVILGFEKANVITSKAMSFVMKAR
jgi:hypothetical protein